VYLVFVLLARVRLALFAVFGALILTALLRPVVDGLGRLLPRPLAVAITVLASLAAAGGVLAFIGVSLATQGSRLAAPFQAGLAQVTHWVERTFPQVQPQDIDHAVDTARDWLGRHRGEIAGQALGSASTAAEVFTGLILALFCAVFFLSGGSRMWTWFLGQLPVGVRTRWDVAARAGWNTFEGYTRGTILVALSNAVMVAIVLLILRVPLAFALALLVFVASFVPVVGGAFSLVIASVVALAARGPLTALVVLILVPVIGQIEGHVLQPLIMSRSVRLHPVVVVVTVVCGGTLGGLLGAVIAVPVVAVTWSVVSTLRRLAGDLPPPVSPPPRRRG
jgi:predicted PurR-regulated permease PerM